MSAVDQDSLDAQLHLRMSMDVEFLICLSNPAYLGWLAREGYFENDDGKVRSFLMLIPHLLRPCATTFNTWSISDIQILDIWSDFLWALISWICWTWIVWKLSLYSTFLEQQSVCDVFAREPRSCGQLAQFTDQHGVRGYQTLTYLLILLFFCICVFGS